MIRIAITLITATLLAACERPAPSLDVFGDDEPVQGVRLGMQAGEYLELHTPEDRMKTGYEDRISDSLYYRLHFEPGGALGEPEPPDTAVLTSLVRHRLVEDDADWPATVLSVQERLGPPTICVDVIGIRIEGRWAEWQRPPGLSIGYVEEVRADPRRMRMVREHRIEITFGGTGRPMGPAYPTSEIDCPTGQSASVSST